MEKLHIRDAICALGLPGASAGRADYYVPCPYCDAGRRSAHLNINLQKDVFRCAKCGTSGGILDLYALYSGTPRKHACSRLLAELGKDGHAPCRTGRDAPGGNVQEAPPADIQARHGAYTALLGKLPLTDGHRRNLLGRGLLDEEIEALGYRTSPGYGMDELAERLASEGHRLDGVPGFHRKEGGPWGLAVQRRGILVPVRDIKGRIQGLQLRLDDTGKRKFRWVSSRGMENGCGAKSWAHLAGRPAKRILLTEGPMKADVIHALTGETVLAVPGVNSLPHLKPALEYLKESGMREIMTAFDMDMLTNPNVQKGYQALLQLLSGTGVPFGTYLWDAGYKGLDDYIWESLMHRERKTGNTWQDFGSPAFFHAQGLPQAGEHKAEMKGETRK